MSLASPSGQDVGDGIAQSISWIGEGLMPLSRTFRRVLAISVSGTPEEGIQ